MNFELTQEQQLIKRTASQIAEEEFADDAFTWESEFPTANMVTLAENDLLGIALPQEYGGGGFTPLEVILAQEAVGRICPDTAHILSRSSMGPPRVIAELGSDYLKEKYLPQVTGGECIMSVAISEPQAGSDAGAMETTGSIEGDEVVLDGQKAWITKGTYADAFLVYARFEESIGAVVVDADADGLTVGDGYENMAGGVQTDLYLDDCRVSKEQILAIGEDSFKQLLKEFNVERCHNAMMCVACGLNAFDKALSHAAERNQFDQPLSDFQGIEWKLARMATELESARLLIYRAAESDSPSRLETSIAKIKANEVGQEVVDEALQIHGAMGYTKGNPLEYMYRLVRGWKIAGGTIEIQLNGVATELKKYGLE
jgi:alkylation response protein AidB-like acyl-CoA dehydrogenase